MTIYAGDAVVGTTLTLTVDSVGGVSLAGITAVEFSVSDPDAGSHTWAWTLSGASADSVAFIHTFTSATEAPIAGDYTVSGWLLTGATRTRRINPAHIPFERYV